MHPAAQKCITLKVSIYELIFLLKTNKKIFSYSRSKKLPCLFLQNCVGNFLVFPSLLRCICSILSIPLPYQYLNCIYLVTHFFHLKVIVWHSFEVGEKFMTGPHEVISENQNFQSRLDSNLPTAKQFCGVSWKRKSIHTQSHFNPGIV